MRAPDDKLARLPRWAQDEIQRERSRADAAEAELQRQEPTRTGQGMRTDSGSIGQPRRWLPDEQVTFYLPDRNRERDTWVQVRFEKRHGGTWVQLMGSDGPLVIEPDASNVIRATVGDR